MTFDRLSFVEDHSDDIYGLWEAGWYLTEKQPDSTRDDQRKFVEDLVQLKCLDVYLTDDPSKKGDALPTASAIEKIRDHKYWDSPEARSSAKLCYIIGSM